MEHTEMSLAALELAKLEAVIELMMLAAYSDGSVSDVERETLRRRSSRAPRARCGKIS
jgi:uncharacterized membrane protein YebE (DUF533 family)